MDAKSEMNIVKRSLVKALRMTSFGHEMLNIYLHRKLLKRNGWLKSAEKRLPMNGQGEVVPWYTYSFIHFLEGRVSDSWEVFEYGSGNSTLWWAKHAGRVVATEHNEEWYTYIKDKLPENVTYKHIPLEYGGDYGKEVLNYKEAFDVIVVDGRDRNNCAINAVNALKKDGVLIWDNSDRTAYDEGKAFLREQGFKELEFWGHGPVSATDWCTTLFYRPDNCFGI